MDNDKIPLIVKIIMVVIVCVMFYITWWYGLGIWNFLNIKLKI